jgi:hypothetical protein
MLATVKKLSDSSLLFDLVCSQHLLWIQCKYLILAFLICRVSVGTCMFITFVSVECVKGVM